MDSQVIGVDLGGSALKLGRFDEKGRCLASHQVATPQPAYPEAVRAVLIEALTPLITPSCQAIAVGCPGPADAQGRMAQLAINLPQWENIPLADWLEEAWGLPTTVENDANCAALGEAWLGAGRHYSDFILLTLGTGVGGAIFGGGQLFRGRQGAAGELGLISVEYDGPLCHSGNRGSLEQQVSAQAIQRQTGKTGAQLAQLAHQGDPQAIAFWQDYGRFLGVGVANLIYILTPQAVLIGGGISASAPYFWPTLTAEIESRVLAPSRQGLALQVAQLGNQAGMVGAAYLAWQLVD